VRSRVPDLAVLDPRVPYAIAVVLNPPNNPPLTCVYADGAWRYFPTGNVAGVIDGAGAGEPPLAGNSEAWLL